MLSQPGCSWTVRVLGTKGLCVPSLAAQGVLRPCFRGLNRLSTINRMTLMAPPSNLRSMILMNWRGRMSVSYSSVHDDGSIHIRSGSNLPLREVLATFTLGIHRLRLGIAQVRSKSELVISNILYRMCVDYQYERQLEGEIERGKVRSDCSITDPGDDLIIWEHLGTLGRADYREGWGWKEAWYEKNGYSLDQNLLTTEDECGGLTSTTVRETAEDIARGCKEACGTLREGVRRPLHLHHLRARSDGMRVCYRKVPWRLCRLALNSTGCV